MLPGIFYYENNEGRTDFDHRSEGEILMFSHGLSKTLEKANQTFSLSDEPK